MGPILNRHRVTVFLNCRKFPPLNRAPQVTLRNVQPAGTRTGSGSCNSHLAVFTMERQRELLLAVAFSKICLSRGLCKLNAIS